MRPAHRIPMPRIRRCPGRVQKPACARVAVVSHGHQHMNRTTAPYSASLVLLGFAALSWAQQAPSRLPPASELPPDLALVPANTVLLISATLGELWNGQEAASLKRISSVHPVVPSWWLR